MKWILRGVLVIVLIAAGGYYYFVIYPDKTAIENYNSGVHLRESGNLDESIKNFQMAINHNPRFSEAYNELGVTYSLQKKYDLAIESVKKSLEMNPSNGTAFYNLGTYYESSFKNKKAAEAYKKFLALNPNDPQAKEIESKIAYLESQ